MSNRYVYNSYNYYQRNHGGYSRNPRVINNQRTINTKLEKETEEYNMTIQTKRDEENQKIGEQKIVNQVLSNPLIKSNFIDRIFNIAKQTYIRFDEFLSPVLSVVLSKGTALLYYIDQVIDGVATRIIGIIKALGAVAFYDEYGTLKNAHSFAVDVGMYLAELYNALEPLTVHGMLVSCNEPSVFRAQSGTDLRVIMPDQEYYIGNASDDTFDAAFSLRLPHYIYEDEPLYFSSEYESDTSMIAENMLTDRTWWHMQHAQVKIPLSNVTDAPSLDEGGVLPLPT